MSHPYWDGKRIRLRAVNPTDASTHQALNLSHDYGLLDQLYPPSSPQLVQQWADSKPLEGFKDDAFHFQMESIETGELVGNIATHDADPRVGTFRYGMFVVHEHRGKGYASEAIALVLRYYFQERRYQKANAWVYAFNTGSQRLHESFGFLLEGRVRRSVITHGEFSDLLLYGITAEEFREKHPDYWLAPLNDSNAPRWPSSTTQ